MRVHNVSSTCLLLFFLFNISLAQNFTKILSGPVVSDINDSRGCCWADIDNDGDLDLFVANWGENNALYTNNSDGTFTKVVTGGIVNDGGDSYGGTFGDYDNDGDPDLFVVNFNGQNNNFYINSGDGTFQKLLSGNLVNDGGKSRDCIWGDINNDGYLDLFVANEGNNTLYINNADGTFDSILNGSVVNDNANSVGCAFADYDNDGDLDLFVSNSVGENNMFYLNNGDGTFTQISAGALVNDGGESESVSWADYDNDGDLDLYVTNKSYQNNFFYENNGNGTFTKITSGIIVNDAGDSRSSSWCDYDNDGDLDLFVANLFDNNFLYLNTGDKTFVKVNSGSIVNDPMNAIGGIWGDYDNDGDVDLFISNGLSQGNCLYNNNGNLNSWINIVCKSNTFSNASAIGTVLKMKAMIDSAAVWQTRIISGQNNVRCQNSLNAEFGLKNATIIDSLNVTWPASGIVQVIENLAVNQFIEVYEPSQPSPNPVMVVEPLSIIDTVYMGYSKESELFISNYRQSPSYLSYAIHENPAVDWLMISPDSGLIRNKQTDTISVVLDANLLSVGTYNTNLVVLGSDSLNLTDTVEVSLTVIEAPVALINANFSNPVSVMTNDSVDIFVNMSNVGGSNLFWSASISTEPKSMMRLNSRTFGPYENLPLADDCPGGNLKTHRAFIEAPWDLQFSFDLQIATGALGNAGAEFDGTYFYSTRWASNLIHKFDLNGTVLEEFVIPGISGLRDLAFDGSYMYGSMAHNTIYIMDFSTKSLIGSISSPVAVRHIAYDASKDGFWVGNWGDPPTLIDRSGTVLATLSTGLVSQYGTAYDGWSDDGPYLWVFDQGFGAGGLQLIYQFNLNTLTATGFSYNVTNDFPYTGGIAGGLWTAAGVIPGKVSIGGVLQGIPDMFFVYELTDASPAWLKILGPNVGSIDPLDQFDLPLRIFGIQAERDTGYVVLTTNDPALPLTNVLVVRDLMTDIENLSVLPKTFDISQNYPNPFNPTTTIKYQLPQISQVKLFIYNILGQKVKTLVNDRLESGYYSLEWDGRNEKGQVVSSGIYIYRFDADDFHKTMKLMLLK